MILLTIILVIIYILSVFRMRGWMRKAHSVGGRWETSPLIFFDMVFTYFPFYNTCWVIITFCASPYESGGNRFIQKKRSKKKKFSYNNHFNIKK